MTTFNHIIRHVLIDRLFHWVMAFSTLTLMFTAFLPILGVDFAWVTLHWITGLVLSVAISIHILRSLKSQRLKQMWFGLRDIKEMVATLGWFFKPHNHLPKPGKYSPAQKLLHHGFALVVLTAVTTGLLMMVKVDTPFWERDPYWLSSDTWGIIYVLHGLASLFLVTMIMLHAYFAIRPEKRLYLRSMILGWISREEYNDHHDPDRWSIKND